MARPIWSGAINFGLVSIPIQMYSAAQDKDVHFHLITPDGHCRLRQKLFCPDTGKEYDFSQTARGYEIAPNEVVVLDKEEIKALEPEKGDLIEIEKFVQTEEIDPIYYNRPYILTPGKKGEKPYKLLTSAMKEAGVAAIGHFVMRQHQYLCLIRADDQALKLITMNYFDEIRPLDEFEFPGSRYKVTVSELKLAQQLIDSLSGHFEARDYHNEYRERVKKLLEKKAKNKAIKLPGPSSKKGKNKVVNLMDRLKASLEEKETKKKRSRKSSESGHT